MKKIIVLMDLGCLHGYKVVRDDMGSGERLEAVHRHDNLDAHTRFGQRVTDQAGRFPSGSGARGGALSQGEDHNSRIETERRLIHIQVEHLKRILDAERYDAWYFAAPQSINHRVIEQLDDGHRKRLHKNLPADLTKIHPLQVLERFKTAEPIPGFGLRA